MRKTKNSRSSGQREEDVEATALCRLFSDRVSEHLCRLRRKELDHKGGFFCDGCPTDAALRGR